MYIQNRKKKTKLSLFISNMINFFQNSNTSTHKIPELMKEISKFARYKINLQRSTAFPYTVNKKLDNTTKNFKNAICLKCIYE